MHEIMSPPDRKAKPLRADHRAPARAQPIYSFLRMCPHARSTHRGRHRFPAASGIALAGAVLLAGCAQILGIDELSPGGRDGGPPDAGPPGPPSDATPPDSDIDTSCREGAATDGTGATMLDTEPAGNEFAATCGGESSADQMLVWTAPVTDYYVIDTFGSSYDTVLAVFDECGGQELACSNNVGDSAQSEVVQKLRQGQPALVLVDGSAGDSGQATLNIQRVTCPDADLEGQTFPVELSTLGFGDDFSSQCGGSGNEDRAYHWVAPADGLYYFRATSETFIPVVTLIDGPRCTDRVLACNPGEGGEYGAEVVRFLRAGQQVSVVVDGRASGPDGTGGAGVFTLDIGIKQGDQCPETTLMTSGPFSDQFTAPTLSSSCGNTRQGGNFGELYEVPDKVYTMHLDGFGVGCANFCDVTVRSERPVVVYVLEGNDCGGAERECVIADIPPAGGMAETSVRLEAFGEVDADYTVVIADRFKDGVIAYQVEVVCSAIC
jgi:hypothetical protein